jgi:hypothetical protein
MLSNLSDFSGEGFLDQGTRIRTIVLPGGGAYIVDDEQRERVLGFSHSRKSRCWQTLTATKVRRLVF